MTTLTRFAERLDKVQREQATAHVTRDRLTFQEALIDLYHQQYTGVCVVHFHEGRAKRLDVPNPVIVELA